ncbi:hypothetical protein HDF18_10260 [Mucilaginibacter sp. X5P1]|uniref:hypothetical protein n=1 Tax=Mucilaginibacter sp. X5P1 TaxID=2723088 RepID=UPI00161FDE4F|nr:hypothetical protein [Mucilaginibacter sp. X5P1]MBB6140801.1 hypothetical protein [Mucilaginibacter sp. X5P1]
MSFYFLGLVPAVAPVNNAAVLLHKQVPVLCYHQIRNWRPGNRQVIMLANRSGSMNPFPGMYWLILIDQKIRSLI